MRQVFAFALVFVALALPAQARVLRIATVVPEGTPWAREGRAFARDVEQLTHGALQIKWYLGGVAGDESQVRDRIARGQLDGAAFSMECYRMSPSMRVVRVLGLLQNREEAMYIMGRLRATTDGEFRDNGFANLFVAGVGSDMLFMRQPVRSLAELKRSRPWVWVLDDVLRMQLEEMGVQPAALSIDAASRAFENHEVDGFISVPTAALAFQFSSLATYLTPLKLAFLEGCMVVANRTFDSLAIEEQQALRTAAAKLQARFEDVGRAQDDALLGRLFARQGVKQGVVSEQFRSEFFAAAAAARDRLGDSLVPRALLQKVLSMLADYRAEHRDATRR